MKYEFNQEEHLHLLGGKPLTGTSSVGNVLSKNLVWWAAELSAIECLETGEKIPTIREEYMKAASNPNKKQAIDALQKKYPIFKKARFAHFDKKNKAATEGTNLHAELERFVKSQMGIMQEMSLELLPKIQSFVVWAKVNVKRFLWSEAHCYSEKLWVGGITDAGAEMNDGRIAVIDFKSSKEAYPNQFIQAAGYALQIDENGLFDAFGKRSKKLDKKINSLIIVPFGKNKRKDLRRPQFYIASWDLNLNTINAG